MHEICRTDFWDVFEGAWATAGLRQSEQNNILQSLLAPERTMYSGYT